MSVYSRLSASATPARLRIDVHRLPKSSFCLVRDLPVASRAGSRPRRVVLPQPAVPGKKAGEGLDGGPRNQKIERRSNRGTTPIQARTPPSLSLPDRVVFARG